MARTMKPGIAALLALIGPLAGCEAFDRLFKLKHEATLHVLATHYANPELQGKDGQPAVVSTDQGKTFENDLGWTIHLTEAYAVTAAVSLVSCDGDEHPFDFPFGSFAENLLAADYEVSWIGTVKAPPGEYCSVAVTYRPYSPPADLANAHPVPSNDEVRGATVFLKGIAQRGKDGPTYAFTRRMTEETTVVLGLRTGTKDDPFKVEKEEPTIKDLTISKTYDRFFEGIDFTSAEAMKDFEVHSLQVLNDETRLYLGSGVGGAPASS